MRFYPWKCPKCGKPADGVVEEIQGVAKISWDEKSGSADWRGSTEVDWDSQTRVLNEQEQSALVCSCGHWWDADEYGDDELLPDEEGYEDSEVTS